MVDMVFMTNFMCCSYLTGLIWTVQKVHYPTFYFIHSNNFKKFTKFHQKEISKIVAPIMILELLTSFYLFIELKSWTYFILLTLVILIWCSTFLLSVRLHKHLSTNGFDKSAIDQLNLTNWPRTVLWTIKMIYMFFLLWQTH